VHEVLKVPSGCFIRGDLNRTSRLLQNCDVARTRNRPRGSPIAHGRKAVRTQSAILYKSNPKPSLLLSITVFSVRMVFIRTENTVGARSAQVLAKLARTENPSVQKKERGSKSPFQNE
jgi:hypothetical protein